MTATGVEAAAEWKRALLGPDLLPSPTECLFVGVHDISSELGLQETSEKASPVYTESKEGSRAMWGVWCWLRVYVFFPLRGLGGWSPTAVDSRGPSAPPERRRPPGECDRTVRTPGPSFSTVASGLAGSEETLRPAGARIPEGGRSAPP